jgi:hypothetical protein
MPLTLDALTANAEAVERLEWPFDFRTGADPGEPAWFTIDGAESFQSIGRDSSGGLFVVLPGSPRILLVSSEGQAGVVAADFDAFITLIVIHPYWRSILKYSANGSLDQMRRAATVLEAARAMLYDDEDEIDEARDFLKSQLGLQEPADPVGALHRALTASDVVVRTYGEPCGSLFNRFTVDDTPLLRDFIA